mmetsp:Transcript_42764/g.99339  ORF Transcript_42764/g.99339 Transcript_42764/m.99339 type:complete len:86 (+) Transcript_42764:166-423(+)|eukprot:CAMPEP_0114118594 /NCGR_PEP_ID=MMETSP0043_2-20121206/5661_1 /TAXON_ID=464988 /ORGANISM="Hemiselmis andersenii, Strain CCMP644" /LENGTH=85 /DNA_ID=CAMNT_0001211085 /DNA_START=394 /DNA_END=651 /DNA_ORIENTATION=+
MFSEAVQFQSLYYSWADQQKEVTEQWDKVMEKTKGNFCGHRHCHWTAFMDAWEDHFYGDEGRICNKFDETGCNPPGSTTKATGLS